MFERTTRNPRLIGILGGMGPAATANFMQQVISNTGAATDQEHVPLLVFADPTIPDRSASILDPAACSPLPILRDYAARLQRAGATMIAIPCNTAHHFYDGISEGVTIPVLHIVDAVIALLQKSGVSKEAGVAVMATAGTMRSRFYEARLQANGYTCINPTRREQALISEAIFLIKASQIEAAIVPAVQAILSLKTHGARSAILACTELAVIKEAMGGVVDLTDSTLALALACVRYASAPA